MIRNNDDFAQDITVDLSSVVSGDEIGNWIWFDGHRYDASRTSLTFSFKPYEKKNIVFNVMGGIAGGGSKKIKVAELIVKILDYYVGIPSILPEGKDDVYRRTTPYLAYGKPGNYRLDNRTLEYRVPGAALMKHPILAHGIISLGATVVEDIVSRIKHCTDNFTKLDYVSTDKDIRELYPDIPAVMTMFSIICSADTDLAMTYYDNIRSGIEKMVGYKKRADSIDEYFKCVESEISFSPDMEVNWYKHTGV